MESKKIILGFIMLFLLLGIVTSLFAGINNVGNITPTPTNLSFKKKGQIKYAFPNDSLSSGLLIGATLSLIIGFALAYLIPPIKSVKVEIKPLMFIAGASLAILFSGLALSEVASDIKKYQSLVIISIITLLSSFFIIVLSLCLIFINYRSSIDSEDRELISSN